jgi:cytochrome c oxidase assembly protein subunit 15
MRNEFIPNKWVTRWLYLGIALVLTMVVIGGMTRLTHSGLSMVHWSFTGSLPPLNESAWQAEFEKYQASPEFKEIHYHFDLEDFKSIYWWEFIHRLFGRFIGLVFIIPFAFFLFKRWIPRNMIKHFFIILFLGAFQAFLGWFMVKSGLVDIPRVSHYRLAAHLTTAFIACSYIYWVALHYSNYHREKRDHSLDPFLGAKFGALLLIQIAFGAFVAGLKAGWVHNTWPLMDGDWISPAVTAMQPFWVNFIESKSGVQFVHRTLGLVVLIYAGMLVWKSKKYRDGVRNAIHITAGFTLLQFLLGVFTLVFAVPISLGVIHQVFALLLLLSVIHLHYRTRYVISPT